MMMGRRVNNDAYVMMGLMYAGVMFGLCVHSKHKTIEGDAKQKRIVRNHRGVLYSKPKITILAYSKKNHFRIPNDPPSSVSNDGSCDAMRCDAMMRVWGRHHHHTQLYYSPHPNHKGLVTGMVHLVSNEVHTLHLAPRFVRCRPCCDPFGESIRTSGGPFHLTPLQVLFVRFEQLRGTSLGEFPHPVKGKFRHDCGSSCRRG